MTKNKLSIAPPDKKKTLEAFFRYYELSRLLFGQKQNEIYDITDIPKTNKFYELAKEIAKQLSCYVGPIGRFIQSYTRY